jgi:hypothetical protein
MRAEAMERRWASMAKEEFFLIVRKSASEAAAADRSGRQRNSPFLIEPGS